MGITRCSFSHTLLLPVGSYRWKERIFFKNKCPCCGEDGGESIGPQVQEMEPAAGLSYERAY